MRRIGLVALMILGILSACSALAQEAPGGADSQKSSELASMMGETWQELSGEEIQALLNRYDTAENQNSGTLEGKVYTHPSGVRFVVPEGWEILENVPATTAVLRGAADESGFAPSISVLVLEEERMDLTEKKGEDWDEYYAKTLSGYQRLLFDQFQYRDTTAYELGILYGEDEENMLIQYQFYFLQYGRTYLVTMTSWADEDAYLETLGVYDDFLNDFEPVKNGNAG